MIHGVCQAVVLLGSEESGFEPVAGWTSAPVPEFERLREISEQVLEDRCGVLAEPGDPCPYHTMAFPVLSGSELLGAVAIELEAKTSTGLETAMRQLEWGVSWLELFFLREQNISRKTDLDRIGCAVELLAGVLSEKYYEASGMCFTTELASLMDCDRVSLGLIRHKTVDVRFISNSATFSRRMNLVDAIEKAMDEAITQRCDINFPVSSGSAVTRDHAKLSESHGSETILTIPLWKDGEYYGALTLERNKPFSPEETDLCHTTATLVMPVLEARRIAERNIWLKIFDSIGQQVKKLLGPEHAGRKLAVLITVCVVLFLSIATGENRVTADARLEGETIRSVCAPFEGYIKSAPVKAGDVVDKNDLMCSQDDRDLRLERINRLSRKRQLSRQYEKAVAEHDRSQSVIISAQIEQTKAELELVETRLRRTSLRAPISGIVISGDLSQRIGSLVNRGEQLFEIAPLDAYRVILKVEDNRIGEVCEGQAGTLVLAALPDEKLAFTVTKITPTTISESKKNCFRVEATLVEHGRNLRPGMEGIGKITIDRRKLVSIWTRGLRDWFSLWVWRWCP